ncbi:S-adenosyl-L-methionine-dependent methyltransferase [Athelia psychrophila]|uniref:S-adenosyl-L-methionine-dependent methyltransferase n=1 Tax=Athelia psychrophila TaxID=1759441 RepID=A0A166HRJ6_9AGAM|nr:S-adenosyl-L-methionine-dependent methyltransferase [Fibularhizoctonia sp. CBS 109695]
MAPNPDMALFNERSNAAMETATGPPAIAMLTQAGLLPSPPERTVVLDIACAAGGVAARFFESTSIGDESEFLCGDLTENMVKAAEARIEKHEWKAEAKDINYPAEYFTHAFMCFGPQLMKDPILALREMKRVLRPSGAIGFTCWTSPGWYPTMRAVIPDFPFPAAMSGDWTRPEFIQSTLADLGLTDIKVVPLDFTTEEHDIAVGEVGERLDRHLRDEFTKEGEIVWKWQALIVTATKP